MLEPCYCNVGLNGSDGMNYMLAKALSVKWDQGGGILLPPKRIFSYVQINHAEGKQ